MTLQKLFFLTTLGILGMATNVYSSFEARLHHTAEVKIFPERSVASVNNKVTLTNETENWPGHFQLAPQAKIKTVTDGSQRQIPFTFRNGRLTFHTPLHSSSVLLIDYEIVFSDPLPLNTAGIEDPSFGVNATITTEGAFFSSASIWLPYASGWLATHEISIVGPAGFLGVTSGRLISSQLVSGKTVTTWLNSVPQDSLALSAGYFQLYEERLDDLQLLIFFSEKNSPLASTYLASIKNYLRLYQDLFGPYPFEKFAVVENFFPTGYGLPGWTLLGSTVIRLPFILDTSLPHEIAHAWWGNSVRVDYESGNWCEGLATYVADYLLKEREASSEALEYRLKLLRDYATLVNPTNDFPLKDFRSRTSKPGQAVGYGKTAMVFHMLRQKIGDDLFWAGLKKLASQGRGKRASWADLEVIYSDLTDLDLTDFFRQWVERAGAPDLSLQNIELSNRGEGWLVTGTIVQKTSFPYQLDLPIIIKTINGEMNQLLRISRRETAFEFYSKDRPKELAVDPAHHLFRQLSPEELPVTTNSLRASQKGLVVLANGYQESLVGASEDLLRGLQWNTYRTIEEKDLTQQQLERYDLLVIGWPNRPELSGFVPPYISGKKDLFQIGEQTFRSKKDSLFLVTEKPGRTNKVMGVYLPLSTAAAELSARKIPHYGRYSYLAFQEGQNVIKATWLPSRSPLKVVFN